MIPQYRFVVKANSRYTIFYAYDREKQKNVSKGVATYQEAEDICEIKTKKLLEKLSRGED